jgi:hypothetical protein
MLIAFAGSASARDRNNDRIPDRWEKNHNLSLKVNQSHRDQDRDSLVNRREFKANLDPRSDDTDGDGTEDGEEGAGTIASFDGTTLTIDLFGGGTLSGQVTADTEISCEAQDENGDGDSFDEEDDQGEDNDAQGDDDDQGDDASVSSLGSEDVGDDDQGEDTDDDEDQVPCTSADLTPGTVVHEAEVENGVFDGVELVK